MDKNDGHGQFFRLINDENLNFLDSAFIVTNQLYGKIEESIARKSQYFGAFLDDYLPVQNTSNENIPISSYYSSCKNYFGSKSYERLNNISQRQRCPMILPENSDPHTVKGTPQEQWIDDLAYQFALTIKSKNYQLKSELQKYKIKITYNIILIQIELILIQKLSFVRNYDWQWKRREEKGHGKFNYKNSYPKNKFSACYKLFRIRNLLINKHKNHCSVIKMWHIICHILYVRTNLYIKCFISTKICIRMCLILVIIQYHI